MNLERFKSSWFELNRPRQIIHDHNWLCFKLWLFWTCWSPESTWREDFFLPFLIENWFDYFNPQLKNQQRTPERAHIEALNLANNEFIVFPITKETYWYWSLWEAWWAIFWALLRWQKLIIFLEEDDSMPENVKRSRFLFKSLAEKIQEKYPVFHFANSIWEAAELTFFLMKLRKKIIWSSIIENNILKLPKYISTCDCVSIFWTSTKNSPKKIELINFLSENNINFYDPYIENWNQNDWIQELSHKTNDKVILQLITWETESFGSIAESWLLALSAFLRWQAYWIYIEDHTSAPNSDSNRARRLIKEHIIKLNEQFPNTIYLGKSLEDLKNWTKYIYKNLIIWDDTKVRIIKCLLWEN